MKQLFNKLKNVFQKTELESIQKLTRTKSRQLLLEHFAENLHQEGFIYHKNSNFWRISDIKTDVIEFRFLTIREREQFQLPESTVSINYGCYYHFIPDIWGDEALHELPNLTTPLEFHCHYRMQGHRTIKQLPKDMDECAWHLDESADKLNLILKDISKQLFSLTIPYLNELENIDRWINELQNKKSNLGYGSLDSLVRNMLLGFTYLHTGDSEKAASFLRQAKKQDKKMQQSLSEHVKKVSDHGIPSDAPIYKQTIIINEALKQLGVSRGQPAGLL